MSYLHWRRRERGRRNAVVAVAVGVLVAGALSAFLTQGFADAASSPTAPWLDANKPIPARVNALLGAMTLAEKVGQMDQQLVDDADRPDGNGCGDNGFAQPNRDCMKKILIDQHTGSMLAGGTNNPIDTTGKGGVGNTGYDWANEYNMIQKYAIENSRLHIPLIFGVDAVHGFGHPWQAPLYPQSIGMGATWDPSAAEPAAPPPRTRCGPPAGTGTSPPCRTSPATTGGAARTRPGPRSRCCPPPWAPPTSRGCRLPVRRGSLGVAATVKHFAGYSQSINGHDRNEALLPLSYLQSVILPSYAGGIDAGARHRDGRLRFDQRRSGDRVALPADRHPAQPDGLPGRRDQRLPGRPGAADAPTTSPPTWPGRSPRPSTPAST